MNRYLILKMALLFALTPYVAKAQVGINALNPKALFHFDGKNDNNPTADPTTVQQLNDIVITKEGKVGFSHIAPVTSLDIYSPTNGAIKIKDGTQKPGYYLTSDDNGVGTWTTMDATKKVVIGAFLNNIIIDTKLLTSTNGVYSSGTSIKGLTKGKWAISFGATFTSTSTTNRTWLKIFLSSANLAKAYTGFSLIGPSTEPAIGGIIFPQAIKGSNHGELSLITGTVIINVTADVLPELFLLLQDTGLNNSYIYSTTSYENYLYAIPIGS